MTGIAYAPPRRESGESNSPAGAISLTNEGNSTAKRFFVDSNTITLSAAGSGSMTGMNLQSRMKQGGMDLVISNNTVSIPLNTDGFSGGIGVIAGNGTSMESNTICLQMSANNVSTPAINAANGADLNCQVVAFMGNTMEVQGLTTFTDAALETHIESVNTLCLTDAGVTAFADGLGATLTSGTCVAP